MPSQEKLRVVNRKHLGIAAICLIIGIVLIAKGANLIQPSEKTETKEHVVDYTYCVRNVIGQDEIPCIEYNLTSPVCVCQHEFEITEPLIGNVTLYYELDSSIQAGDDYVKSRDNQQLSGELFQEPSQQCEPYRFDVSGKPIAPCGEIADTMFTDKYSLRRPREDSMNVFYYGIIKDKSNYHNPPWNQSYPLKDVFKDFAKPKSWAQNIWELDPANDDNNGFENERFIGWMTTSMKRKPAWRLDPSYGGIQNGSYVLRVEYSYPPTKYNGTRKVVFVASTTILDYSSYGGGVAMVVFGVISLVLCLAMAAYLTMIYLKNRKEGTGATGDASGGLMN